MPWLGEIRWFPYAYVPAGWMQCNGVLLSISQYQALFSLLGATYGGDGKSNFALPDLRGRAALGVDGSSTPLGSQGGSETVALTAAMMPVHEHAISISAAAAVTAQPAGASLAADAGDLPYLPGADPPGAITLAAGTIALSGGGTGHQNMQPWLGLLACICSVGQYPSPN